MCNATPISLNKIRCTMPAWKLCNNLLNTCPYLSITNYFLSATLKLKMKMIWLLHLLLIMAYDLPPGLKLNSSLKYMLFINVSPPATCPIQSFFLATVLFSSRLVHPSSFVLCSFQLISELCSFFLKTPMSMVPDVFIVSAVRATW